MVSHFQLGYRIATSASNCQVGELGYGGIQYKLAFSCSEVLSLALSLSKHLEMHISLKL